MERVGFERISSIQLALFEGRFTGLSLIREVVRTWWRKNWFKNLKLNTTPHPHPYTLSWFKDTEVKVSKRCLVNFSIGSKYKNKAWCDVVNMDVCHILLGRPWQFDRSAIHVSPLNLIF